MGCEIQSHRILTVFVKSAIKYTVGNSKVWPIMSSKGVWNAKWGAVGLPLYFTPPDWKKTSLFLWHTDLILGFYACKVGCVEWALPSRICCHSPTLKHFAFYNNLVLMGSLFPAFQLAVLWNLSKMCPVVVIYLQSIEMQRCVCSDSLLPRH